MTEAEKVREAFSFGSFGPPCRSEEIQRASLQLDEAIPELLEQHYLAFDGFRGPTQSQFFWPLITLVECNTFFRERSDDPFPAEIVCQCLFFGENGIGAQWAFKKDLPGKIIKWDARWGTDFEIAGDTPLEAWLAEKVIYERIAAGDMDLE